jgi:hypothetical protein
MTKARRIALLFNVNPEFNRDIMAGIAAYFGSMGAHWQLFVEEDFRLRLFGIEQWQRDGIILHSQTSRWRLHRNRPAGPWPEIRPNDVAGS